MNINGTNIAAGIVPYTTEDTFATHDSLYGKGGWREVATTEERDSIPVDRLRNGCVVYVDSVETAYIYQDGLFQILNINQSPGEQVDRVFKKISITDFELNVDYSTTPYAVVNLNLGNANATLDIQNIPNNGYGQILVLQEGSTKLSLSGNLVGNLNIPLREDTAAIIEYQKVDNVVYCYSTLIVPDIQYNIPNKIVDLSVVYYDSTIAHLRWTTPHGDQLTDVIDGYDIRYSNNVVNADSDIIWLGMSKLEQSNEITPKNPQEVQDLSIYTLKPNQEYYIYIKSYQIIEGVKYYSLASNFAYCKTISNITEEGKVYRIGILPEQIHVRKLTNRDSNGDLRKIDNLIDEVQNNQFLEDGYIDTTNIQYSTQFGVDIYGRDTAYLTITIDLLQQYKLDKLFLLPTSGSVFSIMAKKDFGYEPERLQVVTFDNNKWSTINLQNTVARFIILLCDQQFFCNASTEPVIAVDQYGIPEPYYNNDFGSFSNMLIYGTATNDKPDKLKPVSAKSVQPLTMDQYVCTNGHFYQSGRIHAMCSGERVRLFGHPGQFCVFGTVNGLDNTVVMPETLEDVKFRFNDIPWVIQNGPGYGFQELLQKTYKRYNLKPFISGTGTLDYCKLKWNGTTYGQNAPVDHYCFDSLWSPLPKNSKRGLDEYLNITGNPDSYKIYAKLAYAIAAKYGKNVVDDPQYFINVPTTNPESEPIDTGLDLLSGFEYGNEVDRNWEGFIAYRLPQEQAATLISVFDANGGYTDGQYKNTYGVKNADSDFLVIPPGRASVSNGYTFDMYDHILNYNTQNNIPFHALNYHIYCSNEQLNSFDRTATNIPKYAINIERALDISEQNGQEVHKIIDFRNRFMPSKPIWVTEFGYGEGGGRGSQSRYQCFSIPGKQITENYSTPDRHRSDIKAAWTIRGFLYLMGLGVDMVNHYITMSDSEWFGDEGPGFEMFKWDELTDTTIGAKYDAIRQYEGNGDRTGFSCFGLFGHAIYNGAYPISRAYWYIAQFRELLKDYIFIGTKKYENDEKVMIYCFRKKNEDKGAYVVYYNDYTNNGRPNVEIDIPLIANSATLHTQYIPSIPNPQKVPNKLGLDQYRTGLPTTRKEKYINGEWVIQNRKPDDINWESFAQGAANYPTNPQEGDEVYVLPTAQENPYFPIVGPVCAKASGFTGTFVGANQYEVEETVDGELTYVTKYNTAALVWRQVDAICDYIEYTEEGAHGRIGDSHDLEILGGKIKVNVDEIPKYILFDGVPSTSYQSQVTEVQSKTVNSTNVQIWWNNHNVEDTGYQIFISSLPETGYSLHSTVDFGQNTTTIGGLTENSTYYFKVRPIRNSDVGTLSEYTSSTTYNFIPDITNFYSDYRSSSKVRLKWEYVSSLQDFYQYSIYRDSGDGNFVIVDNVTDISIKEYTDTNLIPGKLYNYKMKVYGLNGKSDFTNEVSVTTLTPQEASADIVDIRTDKLGIKIKIKFSIELQAVSESLVTSFSLKENNNSRILTKVQVDPVNTNYLLIYVSPDTLSEYTQKLPLLLTYTPPATGYLKTIYGIKVDGFENVSVINIIGNFTNIESTYYLNFTNDSLIVEDSAWNNLNHTDVVENHNVVSILDSYGRNLGANIEITNGGFVNSEGVCYFTDIPTNAKNIGWTLGYTGNPTVFTIAGLTNTNQYQVLLYASRWRNPNNSDEHAFAQAWTSQKINNVITTLNSSITDNKQANQSNAYMSFDDLVPIDGVLQFQLKNPNHETYPWQAGALNFAIINEYKGDNTPENTEIYIRSVTVDQDPNSLGYVTSQNIDLSYNVVGTPTMYQISEDPEFVGAEWINITTKLNYTLSSGYGNKTVFVKFKNLQGESNIKIVTIEYRNVYVELQLTQIYINNGLNETQDSSISILISKSGNPTHYAISEDATTINSAQVEWIAYPLTGDTVNYTFVTSGVSEVKKVYLKLKDSVTETQVVYDEINYVVYTYTNHQIVINTSTVQNSSNQAYIAKVKYNKKFALSLTCDDNGVSTWNRLFNYCKQGYIDNIDTSDTYWHKHSEKPSGGGYPSRQLTYTTGTGVKRIFPISAANWYNLENQYWTGPITQPLENAGVAWPYLTWYEQEEINDFGGCCALHDVQDPAQSTAGGTIQQIINGINDAENNIIYPKLGYNIQVMVEPNGDPAYTSAAESIDYIKMITRQQQTQLGYEYINLLEDGLNINKLKVARYFADGATLQARQTEITDNFVNVESDTVCMYGDLGMHGLSESGGSRWADIESSAKIQQLNWLCDTFGEYGDDSIWFTSLDELIHYLHYRSKTIIETTINESTITINVSIPSLQNMYNQELTINIDDVQGTIQNVVNNSLNGFSYSLNSGRLVINCDQSQKLITNAEKYTTQYENERTEENYRDAIYMIQLLAQRLQQPYIDRLNVFRVPNVLTSFDINDNSLQVSSKNIVIHNLIYTGDTAIKYRISETEAGINSNPWLDITNDINYMLSGTYGEYTIYMQIQNQFGDSNVVSKSITYVEPDPLTLTSIQLGNGDATYDDFNVPVQFTISSGSPTHYRLSENQANIVNEAWITWSNDIDYTFATVGEKTLYAQIKDDIQESLVVSDTITITQPSVSVVVGFNNDDHEQLITVVGNNDTINQIKQGVYQYASAPVQLFDTKGNLTDISFNKQAQYYPSNSTFTVVYSNYSNINDTQVYSDANDAGVYPRSVFNKCCITSGNESNGSRKGRLSFNLPSGTYTLDILYSTTEQYAMTDNVKRLDTYYAIFANTVELAKTNVGYANHTTKSNNTWNNTLTFTLSEPTTIDFAFWNQSSSIMYDRPGVNLLKFTKTN